MLSVLLLIALPLVLLFLLPFIRILIRQLISPLRAIHGPRSPSLITGNLAQLHDQENTSLLADWEHQYGPTYVYRGFLSGPRLMTTDPVALAHILGRAYDYPKPDFVRDSLASMGAGDQGILTVEGETHRRQRKILAPAFSRAHLRSLIPIFKDKATHLRDLWLRDVDAHDAQGPRIDVLSTLARATLDVIGEAGFGYHFHALSSSSDMENSDDELAAAFALIFSASRKFRMFTILQAWFPVLRYFKHNGTAMNQAHDTMHRIGSALIDQKRAEILTESTSARPRDLLSLLIHSNLTFTSQPQEKTNSTTVQGMSTPEIHSQISTFIAAGHETSSSALTWCLYALANAPDTQRKLREALKGLRNLVDGEDDHDQGDPEKCEYLDWVVRESLRLHAPVTSTMRVCARKGGDVIPLSVPLKGTTSSEREGDRMSIRLSKGDILTIPISAVNRSERLWGEDANVFRPERWASPPAAARAIPGLLSGTLTFLGGGGSGEGRGDRGCIGWRFALLEIKVFLASLIKDLQFSIDEGMVIEKRINVVTRPFVKSEPHLGNQMPLRVRRVPP